MNSLNLARWITVRMAAVLAITCLVALALSYVLLQSRFDDFERRNMQSALDQLVSVLQQDVMSMQATTRDEAQWDDAYAFIQGTNPGFIDDNFGDELAANLRLDWIAFMTLKQGLLQHRQLSGPATGQALTAAQQRALSAAYKGVRCEQRGTRFLWIQGRPLLLTHEGITDSLGKKAPIACLITGRFLDGSYPVGIQTLTGLNFRLQPAALNAPGRIWQAPSQNWVGTRTLPGFAAAVQVDVPSRLDDTRHSTYLLLAANLCALGLLALLLMQRLLRAKVLDRLRMFSQLADSYRASRDLATRWPVSGYDELDNLGRSLNDMMMQIGQQHGSLSYLADHDPLTQMGNRRQLMAVLAATTALPLERQGGHYSLLLIDLDDFKLINDSLGHNAGDKVLSIVAGRICAMVRKQDTAVRLGGDEFAILIPDMALGDVITMAERLLDELSEPIYLNEHRLSIGASIGVASAPELNADDWLRSADLAMYAAKRQGKHRVSVFDESLLESAAKRMQIEHALRDALEQQALEVWYQPIVDGYNQQLVGMEALIRWPLDGKYVPPDDFIGIAEESGLINRLGRFVLEQTCAMLQRQRCRYPSLSCNVNLSVRQFVDCDLAHEIPALLGDHGLPMTALHLELTESMVAQHEGTLLPVMNALVAAGLSFHLDDFGTGYSSLERLQDLPIHTLKLDRRFVTPLEHGEDAIARTVIALAGELKMAVIAEGVETERQRQYLLMLGVVQMQGYLFSQPMNEAALQQWLAQHTKHGHTVGVPSLDGAGPR